MREPQHGFQYAHQRAPGRAPGFVVPGGELYLGELDVPIAVFRPDEFVHGLGGKVEAVRLEMSGDGRFCVLQAADDPAIDDRQVERRRLVESDVLALDVHQHETRGVPQLVAEIAIALAAIEIEVERAAESREACEREAQRVGSERRDPVRELLAHALFDALALLLQHQAGNALGNEVLEVRAVDQVERIEDVAFRLRHLLPFAVAHDRIDVHVAERDPAGEVGRHHDHAHDPEGDDVEAGDECRRGQKKAQLLRLLRPAERRVAPQRG